MEKRHLLITGLPGTGKTTLLMELIRRFARYAPAGFYTEEVRERGQRRGFRIKSLEGREGLLASEKTVVATVARQGEGLIRDVKGRSDSHLVEVTPTNRQALPDELARWLEKRLAGC